MRLLGLVFLACVRASELDQDLSFVDKVESCEAQCAEEETNWLEANCRGPAWPANPTCVQECQFTASLTIPESSNRLGTWNHLNCHRCPRVQSYHWRDGLFGRIEDIMGNRSWGSVLDAGTGPTSWNWLLNVNKTSLTGVTVSEGMVKKTYKEAAVDGNGELVLGSWDDPDLLKGRTFDTIIADYLIGAVDGFKPYTQDLVFPRLKRHLAGNSSLFIVGWEPFPDLLGRTEKLRVEHETLVKVTKLRDAMILAGNGRPYREYPLDWYVRNLEQSGYKVVDISKVGAVYGPNWVKSQLAVGLNYLPRISDKTLVAGFQSRSKKLEERAQRLLSAGYCMGMDFTIQAVLADAPQAKPEAEAPQATA